MDSALRIMSGRQFQAVGPANAKARLPNSSRVRGTMRWPLDAERSDDLGYPSDVKWNTCEYRRCAAVKRGRLVFSK